MFPFHALCICSHFLLWFGCCFSSLRFRHLASFVSLNGIRDSVACWLVSSVSLPMSFLEGLFWIWCSFCQFQCSHTRLFLFQVCDCPSIAWIIPFDSLVIPVPWTECSTVALPCWTARSQRKVSVVLSAVNIVGFGSRFSFSYELLLSLFRDHFIIISNK